MPDQVDLTRVKNNVAKMAAQGAPTADIDGYIQSEGTTVDDIKSFKPKPIGDPTKSRLDSAILGAAQGMSFNLADEGAAALMTGLNKIGVPRTEPTYDSNLQRVRSTLEGAQAQNPDFYTTGNIAGAVGTGVGLGAVSKGTSLAERAAQILKSKPVSGAATVGGLQGAAYGFGEGSGDAGDRLKKAIVSGGAGAALGGGVGAAVNGISNVVAKNALKGAMRMEGDASLPVGQTDPTGKIIERLRKDFPDEDSFKNALVNYARSNGVSLAELGGPRTQNLAKGAVQYPSGRAISEEFFNGVPDNLGGPPMGGKIATSPERVTNTLERNISGNRDYYGSLDDIVAQGRERAAPAYKEAEGKTFQSDLIKMPEIQTAISTARKQYPSELGGFPDNSVKVIDYAKRVLDDEIGTAQRQGQGNFARSRSEIKSNLLKEIDSQVPEYAKARAISGDYLSNSAAMDAGKSFRQSSSKQLSNNFSKLNDTEKDSFRAGVVQSMRELVDGSKDNSNIYNRTFGNQELRNKLKSVLPEDAFKRLDRDMWAESRLFTLRNNTIGGSSTMPNAKAAEAFVNDHGDLIMEAAKGRPVSSALNLVGREITKRFDGLSDRTAATVAEALFETDPQKKLAIVRRIANKTGALTTNERKAREVYFAVNDALKGKRTSNIIGGVSAAGVNAANQPLRITVRPEDKENK